MKELLPSQQVLVCKESAFIPSAPTTPWGCLPWFPPRGLSTPDPCIPCPHSPQACAHMVAGGIFAKPTSHITALLITFLEHPTTPESDSDPSRGPMTHHPRSSAGPGSPQQQASHLPIPWLTLVPRGSAQTPPPPKGPPTPIPFHSLRAMTLGPGTSWLLAWFPHLFCKVSPGPSTK